MNNDKFSWLPKGLIANVSKASESATKLRVMTKSIPVKRDPEYPSQTPSGPREGWQAGRIKSTAKKGYSFTQEAMPKGTMDGDGWGAGKTNKPARVGKETEMAQPDSPGDKAAKRLGKKG